RGEIRRSRNAGPAPELQDAAALDRAVAEDAARQNLFNALDRHAVRDASDESQATGADRAAGFDAAGLNGLGAATRHERTGRAAARLHDPLTAAGNGRVADGPARRDGGDQAAVDCLPAGDRARADLDDAAGLEDRVREIRAA